MLGDNERDGNGGGRCDSRARGNASRASGGECENTASNAVDDDDGSGGGGDVEGQRRRALNFRGDESPAAAGDDGRVDVRQEHVDNSSRFLKVPRRTSKSVRFREGILSSVSIGETQSFRAITCGDRDRPPPLELSLLPFRRIRGGGGDEGSDDQEGRSGAMTRSTRSSVSSDSSTSSGAGGTGVSGVSMTSTVADLVNSECTGGPKEDQDEEAGYGSGTTKHCREY